MIIVFQKNITVSEKQSLLCKNIIENIKLAGWARPLILKATLTR